MYASLEFVGMFRKEQVKIIEKGEMRND